MPSPYAVWRQVPTITYQPYTLIDPSTGQPIVQYRQVVTWQWQNQITNTAFRPEMPNYDLEQQRRPTAYGQNESNADREIRMLKERIERLRDSNDVLTSKLQGLENEILLLKIGRVK